MGDDAGKPAVVGEQQQAFGVDVEPAHRHHAGQILGQVVEDRRAAFRVAGRGHEAARLVVEPQARALLGGEGLAIDGDPVGGGHVDGGALQHLAVEGHAALRDHRLRIAAGGDAGAGDHLGDAVLDRFLRLGLDGRALLAGAMGLLAVTVEAARTLVSGTAAEGAVAFVAARTERLVPGAAGAERLVASLATAGGRASCRRSRSGGDARRCRGCGKACRRPRGACAGGRRRRGRGRGVRRPRGVCGRAGHRKCGRGRSVLEDGPCDYRRCCRSWEPDSRGVLEKREIRNKRA